METLSEKIGSNEQFVTPTKLVEPIANNISPTQTPNYDLTKFRLTRILSNNTVRKSVTLLGTFPDVSEDDEAIVIFEKKAFGVNEVQTPNAKQRKSENADETLEEETEVKDECNVSVTPGYFNGELKVHTEFINDVYADYQCVPEAQLNKIKTTVVYPATKKHIDKYTIAQKYIISESADLYEKVTLPYITTNGFSLDWVYNILEHKQEQERIVYEDTDPEIGFVLLPDMKWDGHSKETLYLLAITQKRNIKSLRDLRAEHLPLLRNMRARIGEIVKQRFGLDPSQLRIYFHYHPSFYHLHLHVNPLCYDAPGISCDKAHTLESVINNLELLPDYYARATLTIALFSGSKMLMTYQSATKIEQKAVKRPAGETDDNPNKRHKSLVMNQPSEVAKSKRRLCLLCADHHGLQRCDLFLTMSPQQRIKMVRALEVCANCLAYTHTWEACPSHGRCLFCRARHHTLLHLPTNSDAARTDAEDQRPAQRDLSRSLPHRETTQKRSTTRQRAAKHRRSRQRAARRGTNHTQSAGHGPNIDHGVGITFYPREGLQNAMSTPDLLGELLTRLTQ